MFSFFILEGDFRYETTFPHCTGKSGGFGPSGLVSASTAVQGHTQSPEPLGPDRPCRSPEGHTDSAGVAVGLSRVYTMWESLSETLTGKFATQTSHFLRLLWWLVVTWTQRVGILKRGELLLLRNAEERLLFPGHFRKRNFL